MEEKGHNPAEHARFATELRIQHEATRQLVSHDQDTPPYRVCVRRVAAFAVDCAAMVALGLLLAESPIAQLRFLNENSWWIGIVLAALYFGVMDSATAAGASLGKRLMHIEIQRLDGEAPGFVDSVLRFAPFAVVFSMYKISALSDSQSAPILIFELVGILTALGVAVFGALHPLHKTISDLMLNTVVVKNKAMVSLPSSSHRKALIAFACLASAAIAIQGARAWRMTHDEKELAKAAVVTQLKRVMPSIRHIKPASHDLMADGKIYADVFVISAFIDKELNESIIAQQAKHIYDVLAHSGLLPKNIPMLIVRLKQGFDIGLWRSFKEKSYLFSLKDGDEKEKGSVRIKVMRPKRGKDKKK